MSDNKLNKEFKLSTLSIKNKISVYVLVFIIGIVGLMSYKTMPKESFPEIVQPTIYIGVPYPGNSPIGMENLVARPLEKEVKTINGVKKFTSTSIQDYTTVIVEFDLDVAPSKALQEVKDAVDKAKKDLPNDLPADPNVFELDFSEFPVMNVNLSGNYPYDVLKDHAEFLQEEFEKLPEVSSVDIRGLLEKEVAIRVDLFKMESLEISFNDIENAIKSENMNMSGGDILAIEGAERNRRSLRIAGEFTDPNQIGNIIVKDERQEIVYLRDIAQVYFGPVEPTSFARLDNKTVVTLDVKKKSGENLIVAAEGIRNILEKAQKTKLPADLKVVITNDQSKQTRSMVANLENSIISGVILVVLVLLFFLGTRNSLFVGVAIPLSMLMGIGILNMMGTTLNMMVLFSLILALGMLVDNGIVIVENIYRLLGEGKSKYEAAKYGVGEVAIPIIASTATTVAAFMPLLFWKDLIGEFMKYLPITLVIVLSSSLFVALVVNPVLGAQFMELEQKKKPSKKFWRNTILLIVLGLLLLLTGKKAMGNLITLLGLLGILNRFILMPLADNFQTKLLPKIENIYKRFSYFALSGFKPIMFFGGTILLLVFSLILFGNSGTKFVFFPDNEPLYVNVFVELPLGTDIVKTNEFTKQLEQKIQKAIEPNKSIIEAVLTQVGEGTADPNEGPQQGSSPHKARITVSFLEYDQRVWISKVSTSDIMEDIREAVAGFPDARITVGKNNNGPPVGKPINIEVTGDNYDTLIFYANRLRNYMEDANIPGVDKLKMDLEQGKPELLININRDAARRFGLSTYTIASTIRTALFGKEVSKYKEGDDDYKIQIRLADNYRYNIASLMNQKVTFRNPSTGRIVQVPISAVADVAYGSTYGAVKHKDQDRVISIFSDVKEGFNANEIVGAYKELLANINLPEGYGFKFTGEQEEQSKSSAFLMNALLIAVFFIFLIIVSQFNSIVSPAIIMFSVLFSTIGVFIGFATFKMDFVILMCGIGIISLAGVVVNNAIVLIDYTNLLRSRKRAELGLSENEFLSKDNLLQVIVEAGRTRLRPVLLTAITTVLGLLPLAFGMNIDFVGLLTDYDPKIYFGGDNAEFWGPMAWTVIFGLTFATFLTLVVVPVMYLLADNLTRAFQKIGKAIA